MKNILGIDHIALAVPDLNSAVDWMQKNLGFCLDELRQTVGKKSGMKSAVLRLGAVTVVVTEGIGETSQTSQYIENFGPGVHHVAFQVKDLGQAIQSMEANGVEFSTPRLDSEGLSQIFLNRDSTTGLMVELIERRNFDGFRDENIQRLFDALETQEIF